MPYDLANPPDVIVIDGRDFTLTEVVATRYEAELAAHDYAHEGLYFRIKPSAGEFLVYTAPGRRTSLTCCSPQRSYVSQGASQ